MKNKIFLKKKKWIILIWLLSFYTLSVKFWKGDDNNGNYWIYMIEILRWFSVWATVIAFIWSSLNLFILNNKIYINWINSYNFKIYSSVYNIMAGIVFWCGIFTYGWNDYIFERLKYPLSFSVTLLGHLVIPILLAFYSIIYSDYYVINKKYYKKDFFLVLVVPSLYYLWMLVRSFYLIKYIYNGINLSKHLNYISPYWFLSWFIYGWGYWFGAILFFMIITLILTFILNIINNYYILKKNIL
ncbi:hypothetical protein [Spiroplasma citri]|uniref:Transmembrane protein n=2 Tax=Spiroplasma citri TaxID=2133 RepID=A0AAX3SXA0_SPICI|nr:hypothetical protein [Spiroplasma citri]APE75305.1 putative ABC-2 type transporter protein [Spiroplasma citri]QIA75403.1 hypothetical protein GTU57_06965 [Spiroplasma citri]WFG95941.1 hypothetical protein M0C40_07505 [Spiroplasma citri]WFG99827.1 hypothetical protein M1771_07450 [Spiroplasma citri]